MDYWLKLNLGDAMLASEALSTIEAHLLHVYEIASKPENLLAIYRHESQGDCTAVLLYT